MAPQRLVELRKKSKTTLSALAQKLVKLSFFLAIQKYFYFLLKLSSLWFTDFQVHCPLLNLALDRRYSVFMEYNIKLGEK